MARPLADRLLRPERVAIIGASGDIKKNNSRPQRYLRKHGFRGAIYPINPGYKDLFGEPCYASITDCPEPPDHVYVMLGANSVVDAIRDCGKAGAGAATIFSGGFAEGGEVGKARQAALIAAAREGGVRLIGPNSLGVINTHWPVTLSANAMLERERLAKGRIGLVSQSGSMIGSLVSRGEARGIAFSTLVSIGNECDLTVGEVASMLVDDPDTDVILLFLETMRDPVGVAAMAAKAHAVGKPILAYVLGRSALGQELAQSHTGAMVGETRALDVFLADQGIMRLDHFESLIEAPLLVRGRKPAKGKRVAVTTTTGGAAALVVDHLGSSWHRSRAGDGGAERQPRHLQDRRRARRANCRRHHGRHQARSRRYGDGEFHGRSARRCGGRRRRLVGRIFSRAGGGPTGQMGECG